MPEMKRGPRDRCVQCRIRVDGTHSNIELVSGLCPLCGGPLEPVTTLAELVGFRWFDPAAPLSPAVASARSLRGDSAPLAHLGTHRSAAQHVDELRPESWLDDDESLDRIKAVALDRPPELWR